MSACRRSRPSAPLLAAALLAALPHGVGRAEGTSDGWYETATVGAATSAAASGDAGWRDLPGSDWQAWARAAAAAAENPTTSASSGGRAGDRLWMTRAGDTFADIATATTGRADVAERIAAYNGRAADDVLDADALLFVPAHLLSPPGAAAVPEVSSEIREFGAAGSGGAPVFRDGRRDALDASDGDGSGANDAPSVPAAGAVRARNVDLFAGEVQVLGEVDVTRVAVGNGAIVRAEVLDSGELLVIGQSVGSTSLHLWHKGGGQSSYNLRVSENDPETRVRMERMVRMRVRMVEFRKSALGRLGIRWNDTIAGPTLATAGDVVTNSLYRPAADGFAGALPNAVAPFSTYFGIASNITSRINLLASNGDATTLAEPVLSCESGGSASFLAGGEVPYPSVGSNGQTSVQFKEYGIKLDISPLIDSAGNVRTLIQTEISQLDPAVNVNGAPGLLTRRAQTQVNVRSGETIVISGLLSAESSRGVERIPGIGRLPIIGSLFRSRDYRNAVTELVIFVTPEVIEPAAAALDARDRQVFERATTRLDTARRSLPLLD